ncbi:acrylyl-CoA reductase (NADPH) [Mesorhizobium sp. A623]
MSFRAIRASQTDAGVTTELVMLDDSDLDVGDVTVRVDYSTINYKDGLAITNASPVIQRFPLIPGIDLAGTVEASDSAELVAGDKVVLNGWGLSQTHDGGFSQKARVPADWLIKLPAGIDTRHAAAIGTAGYTAMLSVVALEHGGVTPDKGDVLVTGANGGVGSVAIALLAKLGYRVIASTGRQEETEYLTALGATEIIDRATLSEKGAPIAKERWAGAIDSVGSHTLANVLAQIRYGGLVASCGLAQGVDLPGSVLPFILRGVTLAGIDSVNAPKAKRIEAWTRLARDLDLGKLDAMVTTVGLEEAPDVARSIFSGKIRGRTVVDVNR